MNINYLKHWLLQFYTFTLWRTLFERTKRQTVKWTTEHPPLPGNREEKTLAGVILQQEVLVRNKELTSYHQPGFWRGQKEMRDSGPEVLPTSQDPPLWNPSRLSDACAPRKDPNSERLARDKPERNPMTIKAETVSHVAEQFSPFPSPSCPEAHGERLAPMPTSRRGAASLATAQVKHDGEQIHPSETIQTFYQLICLQFWDKTMTTKRKLRTRLSDWTDWQKGKMTWPRMAMIFY